MNTNFRNLDWGVYFGLFALIWGEFRNGFCGVGGSVIIAVGTISYGDFLIFVFT